uniref:Uncharacterized protein n=1 Tax=Triticum urartu TaxID=4572 RepID=A0A8R7TES1_TRIUA
MAMDLNKSSSFKFVFHQKDPTMF